MSHVFLLAVTLLLLFAVKRCVEFIQAVRSIRSYPGFRTLLCSFGLNAFFPMPIVIPGVTLGPSPHWNRKHKDYAKFGLDILSHVSAFPTVRQNFHIADAGAIKIAAMSRTRCPKPVEEYHMITFWGENIVASEGDEWKRFRKAAGPAFSEPNNKLVAEETVRIVNGLFEDVWGERERIVVDHVVELTLPIALFVIGAAGFGRRVSWNDDVVKPPGHAMTFKDALQRAVTMETIFAKALLPDMLLRRLPLRFFRDVVAAYDELERYMGEMIQERRASSNKEHHDLFTSLLKASDGNIEESSKLSDGELLANIFVFLLAGHETTAHTLGFTLALLALYSHEQEILYEHIKKVLDRRTPTYEDLNSLTQSTAVFYETLRMFPPVTDIPKISAEDTTLPTQNSAGEMVIVPIPKGSRLDFDVVGLHYNPRYWEDPYSFKPSRFLGNWPRDAFMPFSSGARACIGRRFVETEGIIILTMLVSRYKIELKDEPQFAHETFEERKARILRCYDGLTLAPERVPLVFVRRDASR